MAPFVPEPGLVVSGRYRLESLLGQGGMGSVWRAHHLALNAPVAVKLIDPSLASSADAQARFIREAQAAAALRSPNVVQTLDFGVDQGVPYIVMELLLGESLADRLGRVGRLSPQETARIVSDIARAIAKAHAGEIVHRDLKPDNVFLAHDEEDEVVKVVDFGVAKATGRVGAATSKTRTGAILGTPYYMSPEQAQGDKSVDWRSDLWSLAVIAYECLLGRRPFDADGLGSLIMQICAAPVPVPSHHGPVPSGFDAWWARATEREPALRFQSAKELAAALRTVLLGATAAARLGTVADDLPAAGVAAGQSGSVLAQSGQGTVALDTASGERAAQATTGTTTTGALVGDELHIPKRGGVGVALAVLAALLVGGGGVVVALAMFFRSPGADLAGSPSVAAESDAAAPAASVAAEGDATAPTASNAAVAASPASSAGSPPVAPSRARPALPARPGGAVLANPATAKSVLTATARPTASATVKPAGAPATTPVRRDRLGF